MQTLGIDLASQDKRTATCAIEWDGSRAAVGEPELGVSNARALALMREADWVGIDAPFGWPDEMLEAITAYAATGDWPETVEPDRLRFRLTDRVVRKVTGVSPLSVSSDRIAIPAWRCARLLAAYRGPEATLDRSGRDRVVEVYPGAALSVWGFERKGYKSGGGVAKRPAQQKARAALVDEMVRRAEGSLVVSTAVREACVASDDALDALISALVARAAAVDRTGWPKGEQVATACREGWIHLPDPPGCFAELATLEPVPISPG